jgi:hypothetical protein
VLARGAQRQHWKQLMMPDKQRNAAGSRRCRNSRNPARPTEPRETLAAIPAHRFWAHTKIGYATHKRWPRRGFPVRCNVKSAEFGSDQPPMVRRNTGTAEDFQGVFLPARAGQSGDRARFRGRQFFLHSARVKHGVGQRPVEPGTWVIRENRLQNRSAFFCSGVCCRLIPSHGDSQP